MNSSDVHNALMVCCRSGLRGLQRGGLGGPREEAVSGQVPGTKCLVSQAAGMSVVVLLWGPRGQPRRRWEGHRAESDGGVEVSCAQV